MTGAPRWVKECPGTRPVTWKPVVCPGSLDCGGVAVELSVRRGVRLPSLLALIGKAFCQVRLAAAGLDPTLDRFTVAGHFCLRQVRALGPPRAAVLAGAQAPEHCRGADRRSGDRQRRLPAPGPRARSGWSRLCYLECCLSAWSGTADMRRPGRRILQRAALDVLMSVTVALERPSAALRPAGRLPPAPVTDRRGRRRRFRPPGAARRTTRSPRRAQSSGRSR